MLARIARMEPARLYPVEHGSQEAQQDLLRIKLRDNLVRARVGVIDSIRATVKSLGYSVPLSSSERFHQSNPSGSACGIARDNRAPSTQALEELSLRIKVHEREINALARTKYPATAWLEQIPGVGPITALYFVLKIEDPTRFSQCVM